MFNRSPNTSIFLGTYTTADQNGRAKGIYICIWDEANGTLGQPRLMTETDNPSYLCIHPNRTFLYAVNENVDGGISAFRIENERLVKINSRPAKGIWPCHLSIDNSGKWVFAVNYGSGSVVVYPIDDKGGLGEAKSHRVHTGKGPHASRQESPHAHMIAQIPDSTRVYVVDLGIDKLAAYDFDTETGNLSPVVSGDVSLPPASGPRHFVVHPKGEHLYVANELDGTVAVFSLRAGTIGRHIHTVRSASESAQGDAMSAAVRIHPNGRFLYVSHRAESNDIAVFSIDGGSGKLEFVSRHPTEGTAPRDFIIDASGRFAVVANQHSDHIAVFPVDPATGKLGGPIQTIAAATTVNLVQF